MVKGIDNDGSFEGLRRYNDFFNLWATLLQRWPGIFIPPIPPKKKVGNKVERFLSERMLFLSRFLKTISKNYYLLNSEEFKIFSWCPQNEIENRLKNLTRPSADTILERLWITFNITEDPDPIRLNACWTEMNEFKSFIRKIQPVLKMMQEQTKDMVPVKDVQNKNYERFLEMLGKYEDTNLSMYTN